jgi:dTMP kinase
MSLFIAFEGLDGAGLSTQSNLLKNFLREKGYEVILTKEQTDAAIGGLIRSILKKEFSASLLTLQLLFTADRAHHLQTEIEPALKQGKIVITDRYLFSTIAFGALEIDFEFLKMINSKFRLPDITIFLDASPEVCRERLKKDRLQLQLFEDVEKAKKVRENYLKLQNEFPNFFVVDAYRSVEKVAKDVQKIVLAKLK